MKKYISENTRVPGTGVNQAPGLGGMILKPDKQGMLQVINDPRFIRIIVAGGPGAFVAHAVGGGATPGMKQTQKIELPGSWNSLVKKYKDMVPVYAKY